MIRINLEGVRGFLDKIAGVVAGSVTGVFTGFEWCFRRLFYPKPAHAGLFGLFHRLAGIVGIPVIVPWEMFLAAREGWRHGLMAALDWPQHQHNQRILVARTDLLEEHIKLLSKSADYCPRWLTSHEESKLEQYLKPPCDEEAEFIRYMFTDYQEFVKKFVAQMNCPPIQAHCPIYIKSGDIHGFLEAEVLLSRVKACREENCPVSVRLRDDHGREMEVDLKRSKLPCSFPNRIYIFLENVRKRISAWEYIQKCLMASERKKNTGKLQISSKPGIIEQKEQHCEPSSPRVSTRVLVELLAKNGFLCPDQDLHHPQRRVPPAGQERGDLNRRLASS